MRVERKLTDVVHQYPDRTIHLHFYLCEIISGVPEKMEHNAIAWISPDETSQYEFCPADRKMLQLEYGL